MNAGTASILSETYLGWAVLGGGPEAQSAQCICGDRHHLWRDKELPSEVAQVLQSLQQLCKVLSKHQPQSGVSLKLCFARTAFASCFWELRCSPDNFWDGWRGAGGEEGGKEGNERMVGCPQISLPSGELSAFK